jgi:hypothetical protein
MNKKTIIGICIIAVCIGVLTYQYAGTVGQSVSLTKPALKVTIKTDNLEATNDLKITAMSFEQTQVPIFYRSVDTPPEFPNIDIEGRISTIKSSPSTYWSSAKRTKENETYEFTLTFRDNYKPKIDDLLILTVHMNDFMGNDKYKTTAFYGWK